MTFEEAKEALKEIRFASNNKSMSDESLREHYPGSTTRAEIGVGGDYCFGIWMVPEEVVFDICEAFLGEIDRLGADSDENL